jgi:hypothetical protein
MYMRALEQKVERETDLDPLTGIEKIPESSIFFREIVTDTE